MTLHTAIRDFMDQYDREAISSIQDLGTDNSIRPSKFLIESVDVKKATDLFIEYIDGYSKLQISQPHEGKTDTKIIMERTQFFLENQSTEHSLPIAFEAVKLHPYEVPSVCSTFVESVNRICEKIEELTTAMRLSDVSNEEIGLLTEMGDMFISHLYPKIESMMENALCFSGYNRKKWQESLFTKQREPQKQTLFV